MSNRNNDRFSLFVPAEDAEKSMPDHLELVENGKGGLPRSRLPAGAYDPYKKDPDARRAPRKPKPRVDLRKLSDWIKTTQRVKSLRDEERTGIAKTSSEEKPSRK